MRGEEASDESCGADAATVGGGCVFATVLVQVVLGVVVADADATVFLFLEGRGFFLASPTAGSETICKMASATMG
jgi:hypothetical protein